MSENFPFVNTIIFQKYRIINKIGEGAYSNVYSAENIINKKLVALKIQDRKKFFDQLKNEAYYLVLLKGFGIPNLISYGHFKNYNILIEELLGNSLEILFKKNLLHKNKNIILKDILIVGMQIIDRLNFIHSRNIIHLDIKPSNFLLGKYNKNIIYMIDFGFSKKFRSSRTGKHIKYFKAKNFTGNLKYSSVNTMIGISPSRRDDIESLGYMLIYLYNRELPWESLTFKSKDEISQKIYEKKKLITMEELCKDMPKEMLEFMKYTKSLKFEEEPNYNYLTNLLGVMLKKINKENDAIFSWVKNESFSKSDILSTYSTIERKKKLSPFISILNKIKNRKTISSTKKSIQLNDILNKNFDEKKHLTIIEKIAFENDINRKTIKVNKNPNSIDKNKFRNRKEIISKQKSSNLMDNDIKLKLFFKQLKINNKIKNDFKKIVKLNSSLKAKENVNTKNITTNIIFNPIISNNIFNTFTNNPTMNKIYSPLHTSYAYNIINDNDNDKEMKIIEYRNTENPLNNFDMTKKYTNVRNINIFCPNSENRYRGLVSRSIPLSSKIQYQRKFNI